MEDIELKRIERIVAEPKENRKQGVRFGIGMSTQWDPVNAGREAVEKALCQLDYEKPKFVLVFSTIHYDRGNGLNRLVNACRDLLDECTPSIGGTVTGFICREGFTTRGIVVLAANGDLDLSYSMFDKVRSDPVRGGRVVGKKIDKDLSASDKRNKILFNFISGPKESYIWTTGLVKSVIAGLPSSLFLKLRDILCFLSANYLQEGVGFEDVILESMEKEVKDYYMFGCGTFDDLRARKNYLFFDNKVLPSALVSLAVATDKEVIRKRYFPLIHSGKKFRIKCGWKNYWIDEIDGKPAITEYSESLGYPKYFIREHTERFMHTLFQLPLGFEYNGYEYAFPTGFFMGKSILTNLQIKSDTVELLYTSTSNFVRDLEDYFNALDSQKKYFTFCMSISTLIGNFGSKISILKAILDEKSKGEPYLMLFSSGDIYKTPGSHVVFSDYILSFLSIES
jgi:hypothetical protein